MLVSELIAVRRRKQYDMDTAFMRQTVTANYFPVEALVSFCAFAVIDGKPSVT